MAYRDLHDFVQALRAKGELREIDVEVDPLLEVSEVYNRVVKRDGPALLFNEVKGHDIPVLINAFGTRRRMELALETESLDAIGEEIALLLKPEIPTSLIEKLKALPKLKRLSELPPRVVSSGVCQEVVEISGASVAPLPLIQCWPGDGGGVGKGRYITLSLTFTKHPEHGARNAGLYRIQKFDDQTLGMHWQQHKGGAQHYRVAEERGERLEVAVAIGCDPATIYAASAPLPDEV
ncbi:MAG: menaquinone biosynthesis decarboxylase, partial [Armatimonadetes bacterium CG_4_9_14_3_um_filter_58_7]